MLDISRVWQKYKYNLAKEFQRKSIKPAGNMLAALITAELFSVWLKITLFRLFSLSSWTPQFYLLFSTSRPYKLWSFGYRFYASDN